MILVTYRRPEQRRKPILADLVDRALIAVHLIQRESEQAIGNRMGFLFRHQVTRPHQVTKQHGYLLTLALDNTPDGQDLLAVRRRSTR